MCVKERDGGVSQHLSVKLQTHTQKKERKQQQKIDSRAPPPHLGGEDDVGATVNDLLHTLHGDGGLTVGCNEGKV